MQKKNYTKSRFKKRIRISEKNLDWIKKNKGKYTLAGKLDEIINIHKKKYANETVRQMPREYVEI
jgi:hypothetical protein